MWHCGNCHSQDERQRRKAKRLQAAGLMTQKVASQSSRSDSLERVSALLNLLVTRLGGPHEFYRFWLDEIDRLKAHRRSGFRLIRFCEMAGNYEFLCFADAAEFQLFAMNH